MMARSSPVMPDARLTGLALRPDPPTCVGKNPKVIPGAFGDLWCHCQAHGGWAATPGYTDNPAAQPPPKVPPFST